MMGVRIVIGRGSVRNRRRFVLTSPPFPEANDIIRFENLEWLVLKVETVEVVGSVTILLRDKEVFPDA